MVARFENCVRRHPNWELLASDIRKIRLRPEALQQGVGGGLGEAEAIHARDRDDGGDERNIGVVFSVQVDEV